MLLSTTSSQKRKRSVQMILFFLPPNLIRSFPFKGTRAFTLVVMNTSDVALCNYSCPLQSKALTFTLLKFRSEEKKTSYLFNCVYPSTVTANYRHHSLVLGLCLPALLTLDSLSVQSYTEILFSGSTTALSNLNYKKSCNRGRNNNSFSDGFLTSHPVLHQNYQKYRLLSSGSRQVLLGPHTTKFPSSFQKQEEITAQCKCTVHFHAQEDSRKSTWYFLF